MLQLSKWVCGDTFPRDDRVKAVDVERIMINAIATTKFLLAFLFKITIF
jgi:hypothetical protein